MERWELEADLEAITTTGVWMDGVVPEWAEQAAREAGRLPEDPRVIFAGYKLLVKMLHDEITRASDRADLAETLPDWAR